MNPTIFAPVMNGREPKVPANPSEDVVELGLLLPTHRAAELLRLARDRHESVGQLLRKLIDRELSRSA
jgi:hypothetical protein